MGKKNQIEHPAQIAAFLEGASHQQAIAQAKQNVNRVSTFKSFVVESDKPCGAGIEPSTMVDLVVIMDTSDSMADEPDPSAAERTARQTVAHKCPCDLRIVWLGLEGVWAGTKFTRSIREYLYGLGVPDDDIEGSLRDTLPNQGAQEEGAAAIIDVSRHFDWRPDATRAIFFLGDEGLQGGNPQDEADIAAANRAIEIALSHAVSVSTYTGTALDAEHPDPDIQAEYARIAAKTKGLSYAAPIEHAGGFEKVLPEIVCAATGGGCGNIAIPDIRPCFELHWGDSPRDLIETDDIEVLCLVAHNPYPNVTLKDVNVVLTDLTDEEGNPVAILPDDSPSVFITPGEFLCFGDLPPCDPKKPKAGRVAREIVLLSRAARPGIYVLSLYYCHSVAYVVQESEHFALELVAS